MCKVDYQVVFPLFRLFGKPFVFHGGVLDGVELVFRLLILFRKNDQLVVFFGYGVDGGDNLCDFPAGLPL